MIYIQIILAWLVIITLIVLMIFCIMKVKDLLIKEESLLITNPIFLFILFFFLAIFGFLIAGVYEKFIHYQWPQKPKPVIVEQQTKTTNTQTPSKEAQIAKETLQEN